MNDEIRVVNLKRKYRFNLIPFHELTAGSEAVYLVKGLIPRTGLVIVWGPPKCGKSFWIFTLMLFVALGWEYRGRRVKRGKVVYLALEGQDGFGDRADAFRQRFLPDGERVDGFYLIKERTDLIRDHKELISCIELQCPGNPAAVIVDTMNRSLVGSENEPKDMAAYLAAADAIRDRFGCVVIIIHHCGIDGTRPRGHTSLTGAGDVQIAVRRDATKNVIAELEYAKDMPEGAVFASRLEVVEVGIDDDGDQRTSCVVVPVEDGDLPPQPAKGAKPPTIPKAAKIALRALQSAIADCGKPAHASNHVPTNVMTVSVKMWREYAIRMAVSDSDKPDSIRTAFRRAADHLIAASIVCVWDEQVWIAAPLAS